MRAAFQDLPWHDAEIRSIHINREKPGQRDTVTLSMRWPDNTKSKVVFSDCYALSAMMNFGVIAPDSVLSAVVVNDRDDVQEIQKRWGALGVTLADLRCYEFETNSTASKILIYALRVDVE